jgi:hypothetical protein
LAPIPSRFFRRFRDRLSLEVDREFDREPLQDEPERESYHLSFSDYRRGEFLGDEILITQLSFARKRNDNWVFFFLRQAASSSACPDSNVLSTFS